MTNGDYAGRLRGNAECKDSRRNQAIRRPVPGEMRRCLKWREEENEKFSTTVGATRSGQRGVPLPEIRGLREIERERECRNYLQFRFASR